MQQSSAAELAVQTWLLRKDREHYLLNENVDQPRYLGYIRWMPSGKTILAASRVASLSFIPLV